MANPHVEVERGEQALRLMSDPAMEGAFDDVKQAIFQAIERCPIRDQEGLHELRLMLKLLNDVRANLEQRIDGGKIANVRIEREKRRGFLGDMKWQKTANNL